MSKKSGLLKSLNIFLLVPAIAGTSILIFSFYHKRTSNIEHKPNNASGYRYPESQHEITRFYFNSIVNGRKILSIEADRFSINKKKLGFLSFGLMDVAMFKNATIQIFGKNIEAKHHTGQQNQPQSVTFNDILQKDAFHAFSTKRVLSVEMEPVCIKLHDDTAVVTEITANSATIRLKNRDILFKGHVRVISGPKLLTTSQLKLFPENSIIETDRHYILKTNEKQIEGQQLTTDIFLKTVMHQN